MYTSLVFLEILYIPSIHFLKEYTRKGKNHCCMSRARTSRTFKVSALGRGLLHSKEQCIVSKHCLGALLPLELS